MNALSSTHGMMLCRAGFFSAFLLGFVASVGAQERVDLDMTARIIDEGLQRSEALAMYTLLRSSLIRASLRWLITIA